MPAMRVVVMEMPSAVCIFDKVWSWHTKVGKTGHESEGMVCSMLLSIIKLGRDMGQTEPMHVLFDGTAALAAGSVKVRSTARGKSKHDSARLTRLDVKLGKNIAMCIFHDASDNEKAGDAFLSEAIESFEGKFGAKMEKMKGTFEKIEKSDGEVMLSTEEYNEFSGFEEAAETIKKKYEL